MKLRMFLLMVLVLFFGLGQVLASVSNLNFGPTGNYAKLTTKEGLVAALFLLQILLFGEMGYFPFRFKGRRKRANDDTILQLVTSLDHCDCLLRYLCELEAKRIEDGISQDDVSSQMRLLKIARRDINPALALRQNPGSPYLAFETAVFTGSQGRQACANTFNRCHLNVTEIIENPPF